MNLDCKTWCGLIQAGVYFWSSAAKLPTSCTWAFPPCILVLYGELIPGSLTVSSAGSRLCDKRGGGVRSPKNFFQAFGPQFGLKIRGSPGAPGPPRSHCQEVSPQGFAWFSEETMMTVMKVICDISFFAYPLRGALANTERVTCDGATCTKNRTFGYSRVLHF